MAVRSHIALNDLIDQTADDPAFIAVHAHPRVKTQRHAFDGATVRAVAIGATFDR
jgi:hypothetical protein